ncbi:MAG: hypothetical protein ACRC7V_04225 [Lachnospiraceae bacterium]
MILIQKNYKKLFIFLFSSICIFNLFFYNHSSVTNVKNSLLLWYSTMVPSLFPFMILSGILIRTNTSIYIARIFRPILYPIFRISDQGIYCIIIGFLCGFPMGARVISDSYSLHLITKEESEFLLSFCNNIGPIYMISFVLTIFQIQKNIIFLLLFYSIPFFYGILLRYTLYHKMNITKESTMKATPPFSLINAIDTSISCAISNITMLGGYMICFTLFLSLIQNINIFQTTIIQGIFTSLIEINNGLYLLSIATSKNAILGFLLMFGGASCFFQTYSVLLNCDITKKYYIVHKIIQSILCFFLLTIF